MILVPNQKYTCIPNHIRQHFLYDLPNHHNSKNFSFLFLFFFFHNFLFLEASDYPQKDDYCILQHQLASTHKLHHFHLHILTYFSYNHKMEKSYGGIPYETHHTQTPVPAIWEISYLHQKSNIHVPHILYIPHMLYLTSVYVTIVFSGDEGNRTPVRKLVIQVVYHYSRSLFIPSALCRQTGQASW